MNKIMRFGGKVFRFVSTQLSNLGRTIIQRVIQVIDLIASPLENLSDAFNDAALSIKIVATARAGCQLINKSGPALAFRSRVFAVLCSASRYNTLSSIYWPIIASPLTHIAVAWLALGGVWLIVHFQLRRKRRIFNLIRCAYSALAVDAYVVTA